MSRYAKQVRVRWTIVAVSFALYAPAESAAQMTESEATQTSEAELVDVVGQFLEAIGTTAARPYAFPFPVARYPQEKLKLLYRTSLVPQVLLLDAEGRVLYGRAGVLGEGAALDSVLAAAVWFSDKEDTSAASDSKTTESTAR